MTVNTSAPRQPQIASRSREGDEHQSSTRLALRLGLFGFFYPEFKRAANSTTGLAYALSRDNRVERLCVYCQAGALRPSTISDAKVSITPTWQSNSTLAILLGGLRVVNASKQLDGLIFNVYPTAFSRSRIINGIGMSIPILVARIARIPVLVYAHNLSVTQDIRRLGYSYGSMTQRLARWLESALLASCNVVVPLASQAASVDACYGVSPPVLPLPYIEASYLVQAVDPAEVQAADSRRGPPRLLLMGNWGPQKDLRTAARLLRIVMDSLSSVSVTIVGSGSTNVDQYSFEPILSALPKDRVKILYEVSEDELLSLFLAHTHILLPYRATGGYSGTMNMAAACDLRVIAFDLPQLREYDEVMGRICTFIGPEDLGRAAEIVIQSLRDTGSQRHSGQSLLRAIDKSVATAELLINELTRDRKQRVEV